MSSHRTCICIIGRQGVIIRQALMLDFKIYATGRPCTETCPAKCTLLVNGVGDRLTHLIYPWVHIDTKSNQPRNFRDFVELDGKEKLIPCITLFEHSLQCSSVSCNLSHLLHVKEFSPTARIIQELGVFSKTNQIIPKSNNNSCIIYK